MSSPPSSALSSVSTSASASASASAPALVSPPLGIVARVRRIVYTFLIRVCKCYLRACASRPLLVLTLCAALTALCASAFALADTACMMRGSDFTTYNFRLNPFRFTFFDDKRTIETFNRVAAYSTLSQAAGTQAILILLSARLNSNSSNSPFNALTVTGFTELVRIVNVINQNNASGVTFDKVCIHAYTTTTPNDQAMPYPPPNGKNLCTVSSLLSYFPSSLILAISSPVSPYTTVQKQRLLSSYLSSIASLVPIYASPFNVSSHPYPSSPYLGISVAGDTSSPFLRPWTSATLDAVHTLSMADDRYFKYDVVGLDDLRISSGSIMPPMVALTLPAMLIAKIVLYAGMMTRSNCGITLADIVLLAVTTLLIPAILLSWYASWLYVMQYDCESPLFSISPLYFVYNLIDGFILLQYFRSRNNWHDTRSSVSSVANSEAQFIRLGTVFAVCVRPIMSATSTFLISSISIILTCFIQAAAEPLGLSVLIFVSSLPFYVTMLWCIFILHSASLSRYSFSVASSVAAPAAALPAASPSASPYSVASASAGDFSSSTPSSPGSPMILARSRRLIRFNGADAEVSATSSAPKLALSLPEKLLAAYANHILTKPALRVFIVITWIATLAGALYGSFTLTGTTSFLSYDYFLFPGHGLDFLHRASSIFPSLNLNWPGGRYLIIDAPLNYSDPGVQFKLEALPTLVKHGRNLTVSSWFTNFIAFARATAPHALVDIHGQPYTRNSTGSSYIQPSQFYPLLSQFYALDDPVSTLYASSLVLWPNNLTIRACTFSLSWPQPVPHPDIFDLTFPLTDWITTDPTFASMYAGWNMFAYAYDIIGHSFELHQQSWGSIMVKSLLIMFLALKAAILPRPLRLFQWISIIVVIASSVTLTTIMRIVEITASPMYPGWLDLDRLVFEPLFAMPIVQMLNFLIDSPLASASDVCYGLRLFDSLQFIGVSLFQFLVSLFLLSAAILFANQGLQAGLDNPYTMLLDTGITLVFVYLVTPAVFALTYFGLSAVEASSRPDSGAPLVELQIENKNVEREEE